MSVKYSLPKFVDSLTFKLPKVSKKMYEVLKNSKVCRFVIQYSYSNPSFLNGSKVFESIEAFDIFRDIGYSWYDDMQRKMSKVWICEPKSGSKYFISLNEVEIKAAIAGFDIVDLSEDFPDSIGFFKIEKVLLLDK